MNSTKLHSLLRDAGREMTLGGFGLQRWGARRRIKEKGKPGGDFSKAGAADRESNVEHMQAAADSNGRGKLARTPGLAIERKRIENGNWAEGKRHGLGRRIQKSWLERTRLKETQEEKRTRRETVLARAKLQTTKKTPDAATACSAQDIIGLYFSKFLLVI